MLFRETAGRFYYNTDFSRGKPAHMPHMPHVHPLSCKLDWTTQKQFYCFLLICFFFFTETNQRQPCSRVPQSSSLPSRHAQKSSGVEIVLVVDVQTIACDVTNYKYLP